MYIGIRSGSSSNYLDFFLEKSILLMVFFLPLSLNAATGLMAVGTVLWAGKMIVNRRLEFRRTPFDILLILFVIISAASIWVSPDKGFSFYNYYHLMGRYIVLYYLVVNNIYSREQLKSIVLALLLSSSVVAVYGFYQYIHGVDMAFEWVDGAHFPGLKLRIFSTLENPNLLAGYLVSAMALAGGIALGSRSYKVRILLTALIVSLVICLALTYSRGAWLGVLAVVIVFGLLYSRKLLLLLVLIPLVLLINHDVLLERLLSIMNPTDTSATLRLALWESTIYMIINHPLMGVGWGAYWMVYPKYNYFIQTADFRMYHAHNMYLNIAAEIGIPGLLVFLALFFGYTAKAYTMIRNSATRWVSGLMLGIFAALAGIAVNGFTDYIMFNIQIAMFFWLLCALVTSVYLDGTAANRNFTKNRRGCSL